MLQHAGVLRRQRTWRTTQSAILDLHGAVLNAAICDQRAAAADVIRRLEQTTRVWYNVVGADACRYRFTNTRRVAVDRAPAAHVVALLRGLAVVRRRHSCSFSLVCYAWQLAHTYIHTYFVILTRSRSNRGLLTNVWSRYVQYKDVERRTAPKTERKRLTRLYVGGNRSMKKAAMQVRDSLTIAVYLTVRLESWRRLLLLLLLAPSTPPQMSSSVDACNWKPLTITAERLKDWKKNSAVTMALKEAAAAVSAAAADAMARFNCRAPSRSTVFAHLVGHWLESTELTRETTMPTSVTGRRPCSRRHSTASVAVVSLDINHRGMPLSPRTTSTSLITSYQSISPLHSSWPWVFLDGWIGRSIGPSVSQSVSRSANAMQQPHGLPFAKSSAIRLWTRRRQRKIIIAALRLSVALSELVSRLQQLHTTGRINCTHRRRRLLWRINPRNGNWPVAGPAIRQRPASMYDLDYWTPLSHRPLVSLNGLFSQIARISCSTGVFSLDVGGSVDKICIGDVIKRSADGAIIQESKADESTD